MYLSGQPSFQDKLFTPCSSATFQPSERKVTRSQVASHDTSPLTFTHLSSKRYQNMEIEHGKRKAPCFFFWGDLMSPSRSQDCLLQWRPLPTEHVIPQLGHLLGAPTRSSACNRCYLNSLMSLLTLILTFPLKLIKQSSLILKHWAHF